MLPLLHQEGKKAREGESLKEASKLCRNLSVQLRCLKGKGKGWTERHESQDEF